MIHPVKLPEKQPDCCAICPLIGLIPKDKVPAKSYERFVCLGTNEAMTQRAIRIRASQRNSKHPLHRYCDSKWAIWMTLKNRCLGINGTMYLQCRIPYEQSQQMTFNFIKFHRKPTDPDSHTDGKCWGSTMCERDKPEKGCKFRSVFLLCAEARPCERLPSAQERHTEPQRWHVYFWEVACTAYCAYSRN